MQRDKKTKKEIEALILERLRAVPGCEAIEDVSVYPVAPAQAPANWSVGSCGCGRADLDAATKALPGIVAEIARRYELTED